MNERSRGARVDDAADSRAGTPRGDGGFTLVEVMAAMAVFALVAAAALTMLVSALQTVRENSDRVYAAALARSTAEDLRGQGAYAIPIGETTSTAVTPQGTFTIKTSANWVGIAQQTNPCRVGDGVVPGRTYVRVHIEVTSSKLGAAQTTDTIVQPLDPVPAVNNTGTVTVQVVDQLGAPVSGVQVSGVDASGGSAPFAYVTGTDGCVFIPDVLASNQWRVTIAKPGYIPELVGGDQATQQVQVLKNTPFTFSYAPPATITLTATDAFFPVPANVPFTLIPDPRNRVPASVTTYPVSVTGLWPRPAGYTVWLGRCADAQTSAAITVPAPAGGTSTVELVGGRVELVAPKGTAITATHGGDPTCAPTYQLGTVDQSMLLRAMLPFGQWTLTASTGEVRQAFLAPEPSVCSVSWPVPGAITSQEASALPTPDPSASPSPTPPLVLPDVSLPCPTSTPTPTAAP